MVTRKQKKSAKIYHGQARGYRIYFVRTSRGKVLACVCGWRGKSQDCDRNTGCVYDTDKERLVFSRGRAVISEVPQTTGFRHYFFQTHFGQLRVPLILLADTPDNRYFEVIICCCYHRTRINRGQQLSCNAPNRFFPKLQAN